MSSFVEKYGKTVSIHAPARGATTAHRGLREGEGSFNPRAREGRDLVSGVAAGAGAVVSIHAPARGATASPPPASRSHRYRFNPRAREGRDPRCGRLRARRQQFQSTRPRGARPRRSLHVHLHDRVSIHAPARGATRADSPRDTSLSFQSTRPRGARPKPAPSASRLSWCFNPRAREGRDALSSAGSPSETSFQSTRPRGARPAAMRERSRNAWCFNPRAREGRDPGRELATIRIDVSIHAPARGATPCNHRSIRPSQVSIHAPARGATGDGFTHTEESIMFQSTRPRGARRRHDKPLMRMGLWRHVREPGPAGGERSRSR